MSADPSSRAARPPRWIPLALAAGAVLALVAGLAVSLGPALNPPKPVHPAEPLDSTPVMGHKRPEDYDFPSYPGAFSFHSMEAEPDQASTSYMVPKGTAARIAAFYVDELKRDGWLLKRREKIVAASDPKTKTKPDIAKAPGLVYTWRREADRRELQLMAIDFPGKGSTAQAVLSWRPVGE